MKISSIKKYIETGMEIGRDIRKNTSKNDMKIVRCILGNDEKNLGRVMQFLGLFLCDENKVVRLGIWIELHRQ